MNELFVAIILIVTGFLFSLELRRRADRGWNGGFSCGVLWQRDLQW
jgi:hypothetical protein